MRIKIIEKLKYIVVGFLLLPIHLAVSQARTIENPIKGVKNIYELLYRILDIVSQIGTVVVIFMIIYSGFLFVKAQGNESELTTAKKTLLWTLVGALILLGAKSLAYVVCNTAVELGATSVSCRLIR